MDKRKALRKVAEEMNEIMGLDPAIDIEAPANQVYDEVLEASSMVEPDDEFSEEAWAVINNLGDFEPGKEEKKSGKSKLVGLINSTKKLAGLKELVQEYDEFESLRDDLGSFKGLDGLKNLKEEMIGLADGGHSEAQKKETKIASAKASPSEATKRREFMEKLISGKGISKEELVEKVLEKFSAARSTVITELSDGKNPKYCKFSKLLVIEDGIVSFKKGDK